MQTWKRGKHQFSMQETIRKSFHDLMQTSQGHLRILQKIAYEIFQIEKYTHIHDNKLM